MTEKKGRTYIPLDDHPDHAAALGRLLGHWAILEFQLELTMNYLLGGEYKKSSFVYKEFINTRQKITLLRRLNHHFNDDKDKKEKLRNLLERASELNSKRNQYVHAIWGAGLDKNKLMLIRNDLPQNIKKSTHGAFEVTVDDIQGVVEDISKLSHDLQMEVLPDPSIRVVLYEQYPQ